MERMAKIFLVLVCMAGVFGAAGCGGGQGRRLDITAAETGTFPEETSACGTVVVYVCGSVKDPGVYTLPEDARAGDAVEAAGGFLPDADTEFVNLAETLADGEKLRIPSADEAAQVSEQEASDGMVNINTADAGQLETLPGIGPAKAEAIIAWREEQGAFSVIEDIMLVPGIKEAAFSRIKDHIKV